MGREDDDEDLSLANALVKNFFNEIIPQLDFPVIIPGVYTVLAKFRRETLYEPTLVLRGVADECYRISFIFHVRLDG